VKRSLKVAGYLRYMDDLVLFGDKPALLEEAREANRERLRRERGLELKRRLDGVQPAAQPATYLGFRVSRAGVLPGPRAKRRLRERLSQADAIEAGRLERTLVSYRGLLLSL